jgi:uncharacterized protein involved in exopolysaccharide biosynthesis
LEIIGKGKPSTILAIAGVLGLMLGVFIAFFREFWVNSSEKDEHRQEKDTYR